MAAAVVALGLAGLTACDSASGSDGPKLAADAAIPDKVPSGTVLRVGDPATQTAIEASGLDEELKDEGVEIEWANISGGPKTLDAFRADAIDVGSAQDIPPLFAQWTGTDVTIVATTSRVDAINHPVYELGVAPGVDVKSLEDLKGKKIAYSPGQAQGALVLRALDKAGLTQDDVELVEIQSVDDVYVNVLGSKQVDVAPLGGTLLTSYLAKYGQRRRHLDPDRHPRRPEPALRAGGDHPGRRQGGRARQVRRGVGQGQAVDQRAPRGVRAGVLRRPRGADPRGRARGDRADRPARGPGRTGTRPSPRTRRPRTCSARSRTTPSSTWPVSTTAATRRSSPTRLAAVAPDDDGPRAADHGHRRTGRRQARRTAPARPGQAHPVLPGHRPDPAGRAVVPAVVDRPPRPAHALRAVGGRGDGPGPDRERPAAGRPADLRGPRVRRDSASAR